MDKSLAVGAPAWLVAIFGAFALSREMGWACAIGYVSQWAVKAPKNVPDWAAPLTMAVVCGAVWVFVLGHKPTLPIPTQWWAEFGPWALAAMGAASASGRTGGAPKTNAL